MLKITMPNIPAIIGTVSRINVVPTGPTVRSVFPLIPEL